MTGRADIEESKTNVAINAYISHKPRRKTAWKLDLLNPEMVKLVVIPVGPFLTPVA